MVTASATTTERGTGDKYAEAEEAEEAGRMVPEMMPGSGWTERRLTVIHERFNGNIGMEFER